ncbi:hypothetical protein [Polaribacter sp. Z022]|uniref:hypothetical protein n=1 Tax=Polaribacter sp. Z022 TaxID=2927125 RepID=UPI00202234EC|nr:hypothetical protein [Polaribacter sp. Z022]MCL7754388.1 hypothetical protein [Polaribacter sp. Z022]
MKNILILFLLFTSSSFLFGQDNEDRQGDGYSSNSSYIEELNSLLKRSYTYEHKSLRFKNDSLIQINKYGKRSIRVRDIDISSIDVKKDTDSNYKVIILCKGGKKNMIADWGTYNSFGIVVTTKYYAEEVARQLKYFLYSLGYN